MFDAAALVTIGNHPGESVEALRHALGLTHSGAVRLLNGLEAEGLVERGMQPCVELFLSCEQDWHALVIDGRDEGVWSCREKRIGFDLDLGAILLHRSLILSPDARKRKERAWLRSLH